MIERSKEADVQNMHDETYFFFDLVISGLHLNSLFTPFASIFRGGRDQPLASFLWPRNFATAPQQDSEVV